MKLVLLACLVALAAAAPRPDEDEAKILVDERQATADGNFNYRYETENGISEDRLGTPGSEGQSNMQGTFSYTSPEGVFVIVTYIADEFGFKADSPLLPTPHPLPAHAIEQIRVAEEQRAQGITFEK
ncbi:cuticle protein AM1159-like [Homarus americanus]|uniref:Cuticle protein n=1 Tax=Homarus americanus TaxID=6706 RepID=A0A8J5NCC7_HOMAM|nr:cuticle protein AM1159-like [Homarus americanus]KAG7176963.1 Cuticle protein [Homarus americanus]